MFFDWFVVWAWLALCLNQNGTEHAHNLVCDWLLMDKASGGLLDDTGHLKLCLMVWFDFSMGCGS